VSRRVLIAEPSRTLASLMRLTLGELPEALGVTLEVAADGREALGLARERPPTVLVADATLPGLDGYALAAALRRLPGGAAVKILLTVSDHAPPDPERLAYLAIDDVLPKPFERANLLERVRALLEAAGAGDAPAGGSAIGFATPRVEGPLTRPPAPRPGLTSSADLASMVDAEVARRLPEAVDKALDGRLEAALRWAAEELLPRLVDEAVQRAMEDLRPRLERVAAEVVEASLPELSDRAAEGLQGAARDLVAERIPQELPAMAEKIVWKVVPEIAEDLIREELRRLTQDD